MNRTVVMFCIILLMTNYVSAQVIQTFISSWPAEGGSFGYSIAGLGDVSGDGTADIIVGAPFEYSAEYGRAYAFNGGDGNVGFYYSGDMLGYSVSGIADINGNGYNDVIIGEPACPAPDRDGTLWIVDGHTASIIRLIYCPYNPLTEQGWNYFGNAVGIIGDINADGIPEVVVGAFGVPDFSDEYYAGLVFIMDVSDGDDLRYILSPHWQHDGYFGCSVDGIGDANGDGLPDVIVGAEGEDNTGYAYTFDASSGSLIAELCSPNPEVDGRFGNSVSGVGDLNGDGVPEVAVGAPDEDAAFANAGRVYVFNGQTGVVVHVLESPNAVEGGRFGDAVACFDDATGDGISEIIIGAPGETSDGYLGAGNVYVFNGQSGALLYTFTSSNPETDGAFGYSVADGEDLNIDGSNDIIVSAIGETVDGAETAGRVYAFSGMVVPVELSLFEADNTHTGIRIQWRTETERDCYGFHLYREHDYDGDKLRITEELIPGHGTSAMQHDYEYSDIVQRAGTYRYWLEEIGGDGSVTEYGPVEAVKPEITLSLTGPDPNPVRGKTTLQFTIPGDMDRETTLRLYDHAGRQVGETISLDRWSDQVFHWDASEADAPAGLYWWRLQSGKRGQIRPMVVLR